MAAMNKCLAESHKTRTAGQATKRTDINRCGNRSRGPFGLVYNLQAAIAKARNSKLQNNCWSEALQALRSEPEPCR